MLPASTAAACEVFGHASVVKLLGCKCARRHGCHSGSFLLPQGSWCFQISRSRPLAYSSNSGRVSPVYPPKRHLGPLLKALTLFTCRHEDRKHFKHIIAYKLWQWNHVCSSWRKCCFSCLAIRPLQKVEMEGHTKFGSVTSLS